MKKLLLSLLTDAERQGATYANPTGGLRGAAIVCLVLTLAGSVAHSTRAAVPTVNVFDVSGGPASELGPLPGLFQFTRAGDVSQPLTVGFTLGGTATRNTDYLNWETNALFAAGASNAFVAILPRNDGLAESVETVVLVLSAGAGYSVGPTNSATIRIADYNVSNDPGLWDGTHGSGEQVIAPDITYLNAGIVGSVLRVVVGLVNASSLQNTLEIFLDADQNPQTGDWRPGHVAGQEFRISGMTGFLAGYDLYRLPRQAPANPAHIENDERLRTGPGLMAGDFVIYEIPLSALGNPAAVDVIVTGHIGTSVIASQGVGDRVPKFGAFDTASGKVVVRRAARTQITAFPDPVGDVNGIGFDLVGAEINIVADQFVIALGYSQFFNPANATHFPGPRGELKIDSDGDVFSGAFPMGAPIPTWGADSVIQYDLSTVGATFFLVPYSSGLKVDFGQGRNDGQWVVTDGQRLVLRGSLSTIDPFYVSTGSATPVRFPSEHGLVMQMSTINNLGPFDPNGIADHIPSGARALDSTTGLALDPLAWEPARTVTASDPVEYPAPPISGLDLIQVQAEIVQDKLVVQATLSAWGNTDEGNLFQIFIDADNNATTASLGTIRNGSGPVIGVDAIMQVLSVDNGTGARVYPAFFVFSQGFTLRTDAAVIPQPNANTAEPGSFTVTIPLGALDLLGTQLRLYVTTGRNPAPDVQDIAPPVPLVLNVLSGTLPAITSQPQSKDASVGESVSFCVTAGGSAPLSYQWRKEGSALAGQTNSVLTLANITTNRVGNYTVVVANSSGSITSQVAALTVHPPPRLSGIARRPSGEVQFSLAGVAGRSYEIQASSNLVNWTALGTEVNTNGTVQYFDPLTPGLPRLFYRARLVPEP